MKILVTGGCGYKGNVLVPKLLAKGYRVTVVDIQWFGNALQPHPNLTVIKGDVRTIDPLGSKESMPLSTLRLLPMILAVIWTRSSAGKLVPWPVCC